MTHLKLFVDSQGYPSAEAGPAHQVLADFLSGDIQSSLSSAQNYIDQCDLVGNGQVPRWEGTGNAHTVTITPEGVDIFNEYSMESLHIAPIGQFRKYVEDWKQWILAHARH